MKVAEIVACCRHTRLENKLQLYREEGERLSEEINKVEADKQKIHGKMSIRKFTSAAREADVKRLRQGVKTTEEKLLKIRKEKISAPKSTQQAYQGYSNRRI